jgi:hypothetical protein
MRAALVSLEKEQCLLARARAKCVTRLHNLAAHAKEPTERVKSMREKETALDVSELVGCAASYGLWLGASAPALSAN